MDEPSGSRHAELRDDVGMHRGSGRGGEGEDRYGSRAVAQSGQVLADHAVIGTKIVTPLRNTMRFVDGDKSRRTLCEHLGKTGNAETLRSDEKKIE